MKLDELDIQMLLENVDEESIKKIDFDNLSEIVKYLVLNNVYYYKDLFINSFDLFLLDSKVFIKKFEKLKSILGSDYVNILGDNFSLIEIMYR